MLGIMSSLLSNIASDSTSRIRFLAKFVEGDRLKATNAAIEAEKKVRVI